VLAGVALKLTDATPPPDCERAARAGNAAVAIAVCQEEYRRTEEPRAGVLLANALRRAGSLDEAAALASARRRVAVIADAAGDLPGARREAEEIGTQGRVETATLTKDDWPDPPSLQAGASKEQLRTFFASLEKGGDVDDVPQ
jgi:hypothetical protein